MYKQIPGLSQLSYEERLRKIKLPTLAYRRSRGDMIELYKILIGKYDEDVSNFLRTRDDSTTRGHQYKLYKTRARLDLGSTHSHREQLKFGTICHRKLSLHQPSNNSNQDLKNSGKTNLENMIIARKFKL